MRQLTNRIAPLVIAALIGAAAFGQIANGATAPRFRADIQAQLKTRHCTEDDYRVVTAKRPNPRFNGTDPVRVLCVNREEAVPAK